MTDWVFDLGMNHFFHSAVATDPLGPHLSPILPKAKRFPRCHWSIQVPIFPPFPADAVRATFFRQLVWRFGGGTIPFLADLFFFFLRPAHDPSPGAGSTLLPPVNDESIGALSLFPFPSRKFPSPRPTDMDLLGTACMRSFEVPI